MKATGSYKKKITLIEKKGKFILVLNFVEKQ
jgi:hypothetical protein